MRAILRRGTIEPVMLLLICNLIMMGFISLVATATPVIVYPKFFGVAYLALSVVGVCGLLGRDSRVRAAFGFIGLFLRFWLTARYLLSNWQDPTWCFQLVGALGYAWVGARCACRHVWVETKRAAD